MKQKYMISMGEDKKSLIIREFAELDKGMLSLLCEETYDIKTIKTAVANGQDALMLAIRTPNMYPAGVYAEKIADSIALLCKSKDKDSIEIFFDDFDLITSRKKKVAAVVKIEDDPSEIDELIEEDEIEDEVGDKPNINEIKSSLKVEDENSAEYDEDA